MMALSIRSAHHVLAKSSVSQGKLAIAIQSVYLQRDTAVQGLRGLTYCFALTQASNTCSGFWPSLSAISVTGLVTGPSGCWVIGIKALYASGTMWCLCI